MNKVNRIGVIIFQFQLPIENKPPGLPLNPDPIFSAKDDT